MSVFKSSLNSKDFKGNARMIEDNSLQIELFEDVVGNKIQKNRNTYAYPAKVSGAKTHRQATKYGYHPKNKGQPPRVCACCEQRIQTEQISICYSTTSFSQQQKLGFEQFKLESGVALFFLFLKMAIFYIIFRIILSDAYNLVTNIMGKYCREGDSYNPCQPAQWNYLSIVNITDQDSIKLIQQILDLVAVVVSIIVFFCLRKKQYNLDKSIKQKKQSQDCYTILVSGIPLIDFPTQKEMKKKKRNSEKKSKMELWHRRHLWDFFQGKIKKWLKNQENWKLSKGTTQYDYHQLKEKNNGELRSSEIVTSVSLCYNLSRLEILRSKRDDLVRRQRQYEKIRDKIEEQEDSEGNKKQFGAEPLDDDLDTRFSTIPNQVQFLNDCDIVLSKQYASDNSVLFNMTNLVGQAFISFQYQHYKEYILEEASKSSSFLNYNGTRLSVKRAQAPEQVYWQNFRHSETKRTKRQITTITFICIIIVITFALVLVIEYLRLSNPIFIFKSQQSLITSISAYLMVLAMVIIVMISNKIMYYTVRHLVKRQNHKSKTERALSQLQKTVFGQFINSAFLFFLVSRVFSVYFGIYTGLVLIVTLYIAVYCGLSILIQIIYPKAIWTSLAFCCKYRNMEPDDSSNTFQIMLNKQYEYSEFSIIEKYCSYLSLFLFACFYANLTPVIMPIVAIYFFLCFWIDKINLFRRSKLDYETNFSIARSALKIFESSIFWFSLGAIIFSFYLNDKFQILHLVALLISFLFCLFLLITSDARSRKIFGSYQSSSSEIYDDCVAEGKFQQTYWTTNPATYLIKQSDVIGKKSIFNPTIRKVYVNQNPQLY